MTTRESYAQEVFDVLREYGVMPGERLTVSDVLNDYMWWYQNDTTERCRVSAALSSLARTYSVLKVTEETRPSSAHRSTRVYEVVDLSDDMRPRHGGTKLGVNRTRAAKPKPEPVRKTSPQIDDSSARAFLSRPAPNPDEDDLNAHLVDAQMIFGELDVALELAIEASDSAREKVKEITGRQF